MPELPMRKAGIIACSCEELAEGTVARLAAYRAKWLANAAARHDDHFMSAVIGH